MSLKTHGGYTFGKSSGQVGRDAFRARSTYADLSQTADERERLLANLAAQHAAAVASGIAPNLLPSLNSQMSKPDIDAAMRQINQLRGRPTNLAAANRLNAQPSPMQVKSAAPPLLRRPSDAPAPTPRQPSAVTGALLGMKPPGTPAPVAPTAPAPIPGSFTGFVKTPTGLQGPATRPDGSAMTNPDGTQRFIGSLKNSVPATVESQVLSTGVGPRNYKGEAAISTAGSKIDTTDAQGKKISLPVGGAGIDVDPQKDMRINWLAKGDPLIGGADRGVVIPAKYSPTGAPSVGTARDVFAPIKPGAPKPAPIAPVVPPAMAALNPMKPTGASAGTLANPAPPSRSSMLTKPPASPFPALGAPVTPPQIAAPAASPVPAPAPPPAPAMDDEERRRRAFAMGGGKTFSGF